MFARKNVQRSSCDLIRPDIQLYVWSTAIHIHQVRSSILEKEPATPAKLLILREN